MLPALAAVRAQQLPLFVKLEQGTRDPETNLTDGDMSLAGQIAQAHLKEFPDE